MKSFEADLKTAHEAGRPEFKEFLEWMIDVYASSECGRYNKDRAPYGYLIRGFKES